MTCATVIIVSSAIVGTACTNAATSKTATSEASAGSLYATHAAIGQDISSIDEISYATCGTCHGGYEDIVAATENKWEGVGQIKAANPHASHSSNAYKCTDCHSLTGYSILRCNQCHAFEVPEGWTSPDTDTSVYGITKTEAAY